MTESPKKRSSLNSGMLYGILAAAAAVICLVMGFTERPQLYPIDFGQYEFVMRDTGLAWTAEDIAAGDLQYERPLTHFDYAEISWFRLLTPHAGNSIVYPITLIRLFTEPFGLNFSVDVLAIVLSVILVVCIFLLMESLQRLFGIYSLIPVTGLCLLFTDSNFCAILRGLYPQGVMIVYTLLYIAALCGYFASDEKKRLRYMTLVAISTILLIRSGTFMVVFLPAFILMGIYLIQREKKLLSKHLTGTVTTVVITAAFMMRAFSAVSDDPDLMSDAAAYSSFFNTMLPNSESPSVLIKEFGLDESYLADMGRSYYDPASSFTHNPHDEAEAEFLFTRITPKNILISYLRHPEILSHSVENYPSKADSYENMRNAPLNSSGGEFALYRNPSGIMGILRNIFHPDYLVFLVIVTVLGVAAFFAGAAMNRPAALYMGIFAICSGFYLPFVTIFCGYSAGTQPILYQVFLQDLLTFILIPLVFLVYGRLRIWMHENSRNPLPVTVLGNSTLTADEGEETLRKPGFLSAFFGKALSLINRFFSSANRTALFFVGMATVMLLIVFLPANHPGTVNNGDYGRMMAQLDCSWDSEYYYDTVNQVLHKVIENYVFYKPIDPLKLTPIRPTYALYWFTSIVRLFTEPFNITFSTYYMAFVMGFITIACIGIIVRDLYPHCGKWACLVGFLLCTMFMSETYLVWYNSMFGEGTIMEGLVLTLMCSVHLIAAKPKNQFFTLLWMIALFFSMSILCGGKAQMLLAVPGACILFLFIAWHCRPFRYDLQTLWFIAAVGLCVGLVIGGIGVYFSDREEDGVSFRHSTWQAYFYGIFMISDDPIGDMEELGIDTKMAVDIGKYVHFDDDSLYVYPPLSAAAKTAFYDHVSMKTTVIWYLKHPTKLWYIFDYTAGQTKELYTGFRIYKFDDYSDEDHREVDGFDFWPGWRGSFSPGNFLGYVILYLLIIFASVRMMLDKKVPERMRLLPSVALFVMLTGVLQYPLSVMGNGFADNQKELFPFSLCHDVLICMCICYVVYRLQTYRRNDHEESNGSVRNQAGSDQDVPAGIGAEEE